jgi:hypothetical protein
MSMASAERPPYPTTGEVVGTGGARFGGRHRPPFRTALVLLASAALLAPAAATMDTDPATAAAPRAAATPADSADAGNGSYGRRVCWWRNGRRICRWYPG